MFHNSHSTVKICTTFLQLKSTHGMHTLLLPFSNRYKDLINYTDSLLIKNSSGIVIALTTTFFSVQVNVFRQLIFSAPHKYTE